MIFNGQTDHGLKRALRLVAVLTAGAMVWLAGPAAAFARFKPAPRPVSRLRSGTTDGLTPAQRAKVEALKHTQHPDVRPLTEKQMRGITGRGQFRNAQFTGSLPWQKSLRDVNLCNGNLFKNFTDMQVAPGRGAGLLLSRSYNSDDDTVGPFGIGWTHAYDIQMTEAGVDPATQAEKVNRKDFFGAQHKYNRDADGPLHAATLPLRPAFQQVRPGACQRPQRPHRGHVRLIL